MKLKYIIVDPMASKYPGLTPYNYCANNPMILTDPNGEDWEPTVDETNKTITICATYYTSNDNKGRLQKGLDAWNSQSGNYEYTTGEGDNQKTYTVNFNLQAAEGDFKTDADAATAWSRDGKSNFFQVNDDGLGPNTRGVAKSGVDIQVRPNAPARTDAHEIGHTLGLGEGIGLMESGGNGNLIMRPHIMTILNASGIKTIEQPAPRYDKAKPAHTYNMIGTLGRKSIK
jgi:hypothetical protein